MADATDLNRLGFMQTWFRQVDGSQDGTVETARAVVLFIRNLREKTLGTYVQRKEFLDYAGKIWSEVRRIAWERIEHEQRLGAEGHRRAERLSRELLAWAEQFESRLHWWACRGNGNSLEPLAEGRSEPGAEQDLKTANQRFDLEVERTWAAHDGRRWQELHAGSVRDGLLPAAQDADRRQAWREQVARDGRLLNRLKRDLDWLACGMPMLARLAGDILKRIWSEEAVPD